MVLRSFCLFVIACSLLAGCDLIGIPDPAKDAARKDADGRATGSACRHAGRAIEDCYSLNADASRASIYAGWKDMNDYMRENKIDEVKPILGNATAMSAGSNASTAEEHASASAAESANTNSVSTNSVNTSAKAAAKSSEH